MKKLLLAVMLMTALQAETKLIKEVKIDKYITIKHVCIDGFLYYVTYGKYYGTVSMVQAKEVDRMGNTSIMACDR